MKKLIIAIIFLFIACGEQKNEQSQEQNVQNEPNQQTIQNEQSTQQNEQSMQNAQTEPENLAHISVNYYTPFTLYLDDENTFKMQKTKDGFNFDSKGKAVLINFFANDCKACDIQNEYFNKIHKNYNEKLLIIGVSKDIMDIRSASELKSVRDIKFTLSYGENNDFLLRAISAKQAGLPFSVLLDKHGKIIQSYDGLMPPEMLEFDIKKAL